MAISFVPKGCEAGKHHLFYSQAPSHQGLSSCYVSFLFYGSVMLSTQSYGELHLLNGGERWSAGCHVRLLWVHSAASCFTQLIDFGFAKFVGTPQQIAWSHEVIPVPYPVPRALYAIPSLLWCPGI